MSAVVLPFRRPAPKPVPPPAHAVASSSVPTTGPFSWPAWLFLAAFTPENQAALALVRAWQPSSPSPGPRAA